MRVFDLSLEDLILLSAISGGLLAALLSKGKIREAVVVGFIGVSCTIFGVRAFCLWFSITEPEYILFWGWFFSTFGNLIILKMWAFMTNASLEELLQLIFRGKRE